MHQMLLGTLTGCTRTVCPCVQLKRHSGHSNSTTRLMAEYVNAVKLWQCRFLCWYQVPLVVSHDHFRVCCLDMAPLIYSKTGPTNYTAGSLDPVVCLFQAAPAPTLCVMLVNGTLIMDSRVQCIETEPGYYSLEFTPTIPWDVNSYAIYTCRVGNEINALVEATITASVPSE